MLQTESLDVHQHIKKKQTLTLTDPVQNRQQSTSKSIQLATSSKKFIQSITVLFETWQPWQRRVLFSGLIHRFSKTQLKNLNSSVESLCHRDFIAVCKHAYPMHRVKERQKVHYNDLPDTVIPQSRRLLFSSNRTDYENSKPGKSKSKKNKRSSAKKPKGMLARRLNYRETNPNLGKVGKVSPPIRSKSQNINGSSLMSYRASEETRSCASPDSLALTHKSLSKQTSLISLPSVWEMGDDAKELNETEFDFQSRVTLVDRPAGDYFPPIPGHTQAGKFVTTASKCELDQYMPRYNVNRNKTPWPTSFQLYKHEKFWSPQHCIVNTNAIRLKELFRNQIAQIWQLVDGWEEHRRMRLLLHLLSLSLTQEQKFVADCIKQKIEEIRSQESLAINFPQKVWLKIIDYLDLCDVESVSNVCKPWFFILSDEEFWILKCKEIGWRLKILGFIKLIKSSCAENEVPDWRQIYFTMRQFVGQRFDTEASESAEDVSITDVVSFLQAEKDDDNESASDSSSDNKEVEVKVILHEGKSSFFSSFKLELEAKRSEELERARLIQEEQEKKKKEEEEKRLKLLKKKRLEEIEKIMFAVKPITADIQEKDLKKRKTILTQKTFVKVFDSLLSEEELESAANSLGFFAIDHPEEDTQSTKPWLTDNYVPPVCDVIALQGHVRPVCCVLAHGARIISGGMDRKIRFWTISGDCYASIDECAKGGIRSMAIGTDERCRTLYAASWDLTISVIDSVTLKTTTVLMGHEDTVSGVAVDTNYLVSCSYDATIRVWNVENNELLRVIQHHDKAILCLALRDGIIVTGGVDKFLNVTDAKSGKLLKRFLGHNHPITALKVRKNLVASGDLDGYLCFWSLGGGVEPVRETQGHRKRINAIEFSDQRMFTVSDDKQIKEWNLFTLRCLRTMQGHSQAVLDVKFTRDYLVTSSRDGTVRMWCWLKKSKDEEEKSKEAEDAEDITF